MNNKDAWETCTSYTRDLTENARKLGFAVAAICWFFRGEDYTFPRQITAALFFLVLYFFLDLLQYFVAAILRRRWLRSEEIRRFQESESIEGEYFFPEHLDRWPFRLWVGKLLILTLSFFLVISEFGGRTMLEKGHAGKQGEYPVQAPLGQGPGGASVSQWRAL